MIYSLIGISIYDYVSYNVSIVMYSVIYIII